jgi:hypothetical protein
MKYSLQVSLAVLACVLVAPLFAEDFKPDAGFIALFNGADLTGWQHKNAPTTGPTTGPALDGKTDAGDGRYTVKDGALAGNTATGRVLLWTLSSMSSSSMNDSTSVSSSSICTLPSPCNASAISRAASSSGA